MRIVLGKLWKVFFLFDAKDVCWMEERYIERFLLEFLRMVLLLMLIFGESIEVVG